MPKERVVVTVNGHTVILDTVQLERAVRIDVDDDGVRVLHNGEMIVHIQHYNDSDEMVVYGDMETDEATESYQLS